MAKINIKQLFPEILKTEKVLHSQHMYVKTLFLQNIGKSKFYFVVSGKIIKKANKRNLFKRRGRHVTRSQDTKNGYIVIFFAKKGAGNLEFNDFKEEILGLMEKTRILA